MRVLVTRPQADAEGLVTELAARGHEALVEPLIVIKPAAPQLPLDLEGVQALLFTSANGVRAFTAVEKARDLPVFAVGDATAESAREEGFTRVESAAGTVEDLVELVGRRCDPGAGSLFHGAGSRVAGDLKGSLEKAGFDVRRVVLYDARPIQSLSETARGALSKGRLDAVVFFSPRTAGTFVRLIVQHALEATCARCYAVCLSSAVANELGALDWAGVRVAERPERAALLDSLDGIQPDKSGTPQVDEGRREGMAEDSASNDSEPEDSQPGDPPQGQAAVGAEAAQEIVAAFGGIRPMAGKLGLAVSTVQGWKQRNAIPASRHSAILAAARDAGIELDEATLAASDQPGAEAASAAGRKAPSKPEARQRSESPAAPATAGPEKAAAETKQPSPTAEPVKTAKSESAKAEQKQSKGSTIPASPLRPAPGRPGATNTRAWLGGLALGALVMALGFSGAILTRDAWLPALGGDGVVTSVPEGRLSDLDQRLSDQAAALGAIETRLAALPGETSTGPSPAVQSAIEALQRDAGDLAERFKSLEQKLETTGASSDQLAAIARESEALGGRIANLEARLADLDRLESELNILAARANEERATSGDVAVMLALVQLRERVSGPGPFADELAVLRGLLADDVALAGLLAQLDSHATSGAPALETLRSDFAEVAGDIVIAGAGGESDGAVAGVLRRLTAVVTVRPVGEVEGDGAGAVVARAELRLQNGDLAGALAELDGLSGPAAEVAADWRAKAEARHSVETAVAAVVAQVLGRLAPADG